MSADRDVTRIVRSWLHEDAYEDADRILNLVLDELDTTPQRRASWLAWRSPLENTTLRIVLAVGSVVVVAALGFQLLAGPGIGGPGSSPSPSGAPTASPTPSSTPVAAAFPPRGRIAIGRHTLTRSGVPVSFSVPSGWSSDGGFWITKDTGVTPDGAAFLFWGSGVQNVFSDPCAQTPLSPPAGPSAADLAAAMSTVPGTELVTGPSDVTVGGYPAQLVVLTVREDIECNPASFNLWYDEGEGDACSGAGVCGRYATALGDTIRVWIVDVDGVRVVIEGETGKGAGPDVGREIQQLIDSIQFE